MPRRDAIFSPPSPPFPPPQPITPPDNHLSAAAASSSSSSSSSSSMNNLSPSIIITVLVLATAVIVSASLYLLLRLVNRHCLNSHRESPSMDSFAHHRTNNRRSAAGVRVSPEEISNPLIESLPLFTFESIRGAAGDCAVCLSKFEPEDLLRLLPICCHAFHAGCIDTWLAGNQSCPLCRSPIFISESEFLSKITTPTASGVGSGRSFRVEIGNVSRRREPQSDSGEFRRSYSIGSFDYIVDDLTSEVAVTSTRRTSDFTAGDKNGDTETLAAETLAAAVSSSGSWLKDYLTTSFSRSSSHTTSFRHSGRFFTGSSRRTESEGVRESDLEASRLSVEIGELFRWLSGV